MIIRGAKIQDLNRLLEIYNYEVLNGTATFDIHPQNVLQREEWFNAHNVPHRPLIVAEEDGNAVGYVTLSPYRDKDAYEGTAELSLYVDKNYRRRGIASALMDAVLKYARDDEALHTVISVITADNTVSIDFHKKYGFRYAGTVRNIGVKFGQSLDIVNYTLDVSGDASAGTVEYGIIRGFLSCCPQEESDQKRMLELMGEYDNLLVRDNDLMHFTASAWVFNPSRDKVLMVYHNIYQAWSWIGGHADGCGDLLAVAKKELEEETGVTGARLLSESPVSLEIIGVQAHQKKGKHVASHLHLNVTYLFEVPEDIPLRIKEDENSGVCWRSIEAVRKDAAEPHMNRLYCKILDRLNL